jgi:hypothetical protein
MESLMQKVESITEELKVKDIRLEGPEVQERGASQNDDHLSPNSGQLLPRRSPPSPSPPPRRSPPPPISPPPPDRSPSSPLPFCSPARDEDEDMYMGDNEADKLKDARVYYENLRKLREEGMRNSDTESESYSRAVRKRKGKARQVEFEGIDDSDNVQDEEVLGDIDINFNENDEVTEGETVCPLN